MQFQHVQSNYTHFEKPQLLSMYLLFMLWFENTITPSMAFCHIWSQNYWSNTKN